ncbi:MAG: exodeoxyribonuclease V alpha subunit [Candidatus Azotimanducaceae bacterium]|jgi:exodeoxyribonuclease V alpha subunit
MNAPRQYAIGSSYIDQQFANMLARKANITDTKLLSVFVKLSAALNNQNSCLRVDDASLIADLGTLDCVSEVQATDFGPDLKISTPLVLLTNDDHALLYTERFFQYETRIANALIQRNLLLTEDISALQPYLEPGDDPLQRLAAIQAMTRQLTIISGGPGTGKTSTVVKFLAGLLRANPEYRIKLAAPTGKAAMRLGEAIISAASRLPEAMPAAMPTTVTTLHRLLGVRGDGHSFKYHRHHPIPTDVLILDEGSMVDLVMFDRVLDALPAGARLIILGDPSQLPSVESGSVLADITCQGNCYSKDYRLLLEKLTNSPLDHSLIDHSSIDKLNSNHLLADAHCELKTSYRFRDDEGIGLLAHDLRNNHSLVPTSNDQVRFVADFAVGQLMQDMSQLYAAYLRLCRKNTDASTLIDAFDQIRLLTPIRDGEFGVTLLNEQFETAHFPAALAYYHGKPITIMRNHYALRLFNGDTGICVSRGDRIEVAFKNGEGEIEYYLPARLPQHETCYAMTVHKSQGSEFDQVLLVLPKSEREDFMSRELLYTGITRTRSKLIVYHTDEITQLISQTRFSGLSLRFVPQGQSIKRVVPLVGAPDDQLDLF